MKKLANLLIIGFGLKCLVSLSTEPTIADGVFLVACVAYLSVKVALKMPAETN